VRTKGLELCASLLLVAAGPIPSISAQTVEQTYQQESGSAQTSLYNKEVYDIVLVPADAYQQTAAEERVDPETEQFLESLLIDAYKDNKEPLFRIHSLDTYLSGNLEEDVEYVIEWDYVTKPVDVSAGGFSYGGDIIYLRIEQFDCVSEESISFVRKGNNLGLDTLVRRTVSQSARLLFAFEQMYQTRD
jgi:hypothetical protein